MDDMAELEVRHFKGSPHCSGIDPEISGFNGQRRQQGRGQNAHEFLHARIIAH